MFAVPCSSPDDSSVFPSVVEVHTKIKRKYLQKVLQICTLVQYLSKSTKLHHWCVKVWIQHCKNTIKKILLWLYLIIHNIIITIIIIDLWFMVIQYFINSVATAAANESFHSDFWLLIESSIVWFYCRETSPSGSSNSPDIGMILEVLSYCFSTAG